MIKMINYINSLLLFFIIFTVSSFVFSSQAVEKYVSVEINNKILNTIKENGYFNVNKSFEIKLGQQISDELNNVRKFYFLTHPSQLEPSINIIKNNLKYKIAFSEKTREITYIQTKDSDFRTIDDHYVGEISLISKHDIKKYPYHWIYGPRTADGWLPVFGFNEKSFTLKLNDPECKNCIFVKTIFFIKTPHIPKMMH